MSEDTNVDLDSLLDVSLDDLADLPEFKVFPAGAHRCMLTLEKKVINKHPAVEAKLKYIENMEMSDPTSEVPEAGTESSVAYMLDNEFGQGNFKKLVVPLAQHLGVSRVPEVIEGTQGGIEVVVVTKTRQNKDKTQTYLDIVSLAVV